ncbi:MAG: hypothetical protein D6720_09210 [Gammaproteobacteria bacterium]|nr:MAG: hypothetical protein D6720_09210 [Gammaproteobacteria bacterium]
MSRIDGIPIFAARRDQVPARLYNLWRRALMRMGRDIHLRLHGLKEMELILERDAWVVVDHNRNKVPVLAWVDFQVPPVRTLHEPIPCTLNHYHFMASGLRARVLELLEEALEQEFRRNRLPPP